MQIFGVPVEVLTDSELLNMVENMIHSGDSSKFEKNYSRTNNEDAPQYESRKESVNCMPLDANNRYGGVMEKIFLRKKGSEMVDGLLKDVLYTADVSEKGFVLEVNLHYPDGLHDA